MTACVLIIGCPTDDEPPLDALEIPHGYPPYIDEDVGRLSTELLTVGYELDEALSEIERLEDEIERLQGEIDALKAVEKEEKPAKEDNNAALETKSKESQPNEVAAGTYEATHYTAYCDGCSGITYSGHDLRQSIYDAQGRRIVAVDPNSIPLGSVLNVTYSGGSSFTAIASDIGGDIKGKRIDIAVETKGEAYRLGRQAVSITVLK